jgi:DNA-binding transcriptional ArsR family regulator
MTQTGSPDHEDSPVRDEPAMSGDHSRQSDIGEATGGQPMPGTGGPQHAQRAGRLTRKMKLLNSFIDSTAQGLDSQTAVLWVVLFRHERDGAVKISVKRIAKIMNVHPRTVSRHLRILKQNGLLRKLKPGVQGVSGAVYQIGRKDLAADNPLRKLPSGHAGSQAKGPPKGQAAEET